MVLIGAAVTVAFAILVAYPALLANVSENAARIDANEKHIELLWESHQVQHEISNGAGETNR